MRVTVTDIIIATARHYDITKAELTGTDRHRIYAWPRQMAQYLAREMTGRSLPSISARFSGQDHTTCLHSVRVIAHRLTQSADLRQEMQIIASNARVQASLRKAWEAQRVSEPFVTVIPPKPLPHTLRERKYTMPVLRTATVRHAPPVRGGEG